MIIRYAEEKNFIELRQFYDGMCKVLSGKDFLPEGDKGGFPPDEMIKDAIKERNQFIGIEDGRIVAAYIMNHDRDEAYHAVKWLRFLYKGIIIKHNKTEPTYTKTSLFLCEKRRFFMARTEKGVVATI